MLAIALAGGVVAWIALGRQHESANPPAKQTAAPVTVPSTSIGAAATPVGPVAETAGALATVSRTLKVPIYWAGPSAGFTYELTQTEAGRVYVRYLPPGVKVGDPKATYLIVATYPFPNAYKALVGVAKGRQLAVPGGGIAFVDPTYPKSVHMAFHGVPYQIEVYDPRPQRSREVALSGAVRPAG